MFKTIKYILMLFVAAECYVGNLCSQDITFSCEIEWKKKDLYVLQYDTAVVPFVSFSYKNNTNDSVYFYDLLGMSYYSVPYLGFRYYFVGLINERYSPEAEELFFNTLPDWTGNEYTVTFLTMEQSDSYWVVLYKKGAKGKDNYETRAESAEHIILEKIESSLRSQFFLDEDSSNLQYPLFHNPSKIRELDSIWSYFKKKPIGTEPFLLMTEQERFELGGIFLKPYESKSFEFDLTPFFLLKGSYNFIIQAQKLLDYLTVSGVKQKLPKIYNGYKLYFGKINGASVNLEIK